MSYFMRFFLTDGPPPSVDAIAAALGQRDSAVLLTHDGAEDARADLYFADKLYAEIEVNSLGDEVFDEDRDELLDELAKQDDPRAAEAAEHLRETTGAVVLCVYEPGHEDYPRLNLLIDWLFETRAGTLQVDEEGLFDRYGRRIVALL
ncbi:MAG TPA: hypothetical protein VER79_14190 [Candidatus Limnocylindrales bacterium]|nr:hypothetical protein [Candidatus Limnocylindrales bacterium]